MKNENNIAEKLENKTIFITGASGTIGRNIILFIERLNTEKNANIKVAACVRDKQKAISLIGKSDFLTLYQGDITDNAFFTIIDEPIDYIVHCAANTNSKIMVTNPVETLDGIVIGTRNILDFAFANQVKSMVYLSSMEIYGKLPYEEARVTEEKTGEVDLLSARSCYPLGKRIAENYCYCYCNEYGVPVKIARLAQVIGKGISPEDNRVYAQFARSAIREEDIILHTAGESMGNYVDAEEAVEALFLILLKGENGSAYNVVNEENSMSIKEMAEMVAEKIAHNNIQVKFDIPQNNVYGYSSSTGMKLSGEKIRKLGWNPVVSLEDMYRKMIKEMGDQ